MTRQRKLIWGKTAVILSTVPALIFAYSEGPDPGKSGVPTEQTCIAAGCHTGTVNTGTGSVTATFSGGGQTYTPGAVQRITVTVSDSTQRRWGFQLTARRESDVKGQAGTFKSIDATTSLICSNNALTTQQESNNGPNQGCPAAMPLQYIQHTIAKTGAGSATFEFDWTPPSTDVGNVIVYVAGNAANGDTTSNGDRIYTNTHKLTPQAGGGGPKPAISSGGVTNGASFQPGIAAGSWVTIKGTNLANVAAEGRIWRADEIVNNRLPTSLDGVSATINGKPAYVYYISPTQVNVLAPADSATGPVSVVVTNNGTASDPVSANLQTFSPAVFAYGGTNAIATRHPDGTLVGDPARVPGTVQVKPGDVIILWGTGFGPTSPDFPDGQVITGSHAAATAPTVTIGGVSAPVVGVALSPGSAGLYQVAVTVPNAADGDQKVVASVGGVSSPDTLTISIKR